VHTICKSLAALIVGAALVGSWQGGIAQAADPWELKQTADSCYLERSFGTGERRIDLLIQSFGSTTPYHVMIRGESLPLRQQRAESARVGFGGEKTTDDALVLIGKSGKLPMIVIAAGPPRPFQLNVLAWLYQGTRSTAHMVVPIDPSGTELHVEVEGNDPIDLALGPMSSEYGRLDACAAAVEHKWAVATVPNGAAMDAPKMAPETAASWQVKYPANMLINRISGLVELRMTVDAAGRAHDCVVQMVTWSPQLGEQACSDIEEYARFEPAHDAHGKPVTGFYRGAVIYMIHDWG
jgi:hypothetical protein